MKRRRAYVSTGLSAVTVVMIWGLAMSAPPAPPPPTPVRFGPDTQLSVATPGLHDFVEPTIAASPLDPRNLVAGFFGETGKFPSSCFFRSSRDGGTTWAPGGMLAVKTPDDLCADPSLAADSAGTFYYAYLDLSPGATDLRVARSTDGGATFPESTVVVASGTTSAGPNPDKDWIAVDTQRNSKYRGTIYLTYTDVASGATRIAIVISRNAGRSWSAPVAISPAVPFTDPIVEVAEGSLPVVAPDGTVFVFYLHANQQTMRSSIRFVKSTDGGKSWSQPADAAADLPTPGLFFTLDDGSPGFGSDALAGFLAWSYPAAAIAPDGALYVAWTDFPQGSCTTLVRDGYRPTPACTNADVRLAVSRDVGRSWSAPVKVSDESGQTDQFFPWIAAHEGGLVSIVWQDKRLDPDNANFDLFYTNTGDGRRFLPNVRVSTQSSLGGHAGFIGDYNNLVVSGDSIVPIWNDLRNSSGVEIFTARGTLVP